MQRSCLIAQVLLFFACLLGDSQVEILPLSSYSAIETLRENSQDRFRNSLAFFSLGLDEKAYEILEDYEPSDLEDRIRTFLLKTILAYRIGKYQACLKYSETLRGLQVWSQNLEKIYLSCLFSLEQWQKIVDVYRQTNNEKYDSDMFFMVIKAAVKSGNLDLITSILSKVTKEQRKELLMEATSADPSAVVKLAEYFEDLDSCLFALFRDKAVSAPEGFKPELTEEIIHRCKRDA